MIELWLHGRLVDDGDASLALAKRIGVTAAVASSAEEARLMRAHGLRPWACLGAFAAAPEEADLLCRDGHDQARVWFGSGCPSNPFLRQRLLDRLAEYSAWPIEGVLLDGIRFASPYEGPDTYFTCTCAWCRAAATDRGFSFRRITDALRGASARPSQLTGKQLSRLQQGMLSPVDGLPYLLTSLGLAEWMAFRAALIADVVRQVHSHLEHVAPGLSLGAYLFTPALAPLVGQDYSVLARHLDVIAPMIYRFGDGPACLPAELGALAASFGETEDGAALALVARSLGLDAEGRPGTGMPVATLATESSRARARMSGAATLAPIIWLDDPDMPAATAAVLAGRPEAVSFYAVGSQRDAHLVAAAALLRARSTVQPLG